MCRKWCIEAFYAKFVFYFIWRYIIKIIHQSHQQLFDLYIGCFIPLLNIDVWLQVASRRVVVVCGVILLLLSLFPVFSAVCVMIPVPVVGGLLLINFSKAMTYPKFFLGIINPCNAELFLYKPRRSKEFFFNLKSSWMSQLALSGSFEYLCYGFTDVRNILIILVRGLYTYLTCMTYTDVRFWRISPVPELKGSS